MADTTILPLIHPKQERVNRSQMIGLMDKDFEFDKLSVEVKTIFPKQGTIYFNNKSVAKDLNFSGPKIDVLGEASQIAEAAWNVLGGLTQDTKSAVLDLGQQVFGLGESKPDVLSQASEVTQAAWENHPITQAENVARQKEQAQALKDAQEIKFRLDWIQDLNKAQLQENQIRLMSESLRITGESVTDEYIKLAGLNSSLDKEHILNIATLHKVAEKKEELEKTKKQAENAQIPSPAKQDPADRDATFEGRTISAGGV